MKPSIFFVASLFLVSCIFMALTMLFGQWRVYTEMQIFALLAYISRGLAWFFAAATGAMIAKIGFSEGGDNFGR